MKVPKQIERRRLTGLGLGKGNRISINEDSYSEIPRKRMRNDSENDDESSDDIDSEEETIEETRDTFVQSNDRVECGESSYKYLNKSRRFLDYILGNFYHICIISEITGASSTVDNDRTQLNIKYNINYICTVKSAYPEYREYYSEGDKRVLVMSVNKFKFMISEKLINHLDIHTPIPQHSDRNKYIESGDVSFNEIEDKDFIIELITYFKLDEYIVETEMMMNYKTIERDKVLTVHQNISQMIENGTIFNLPFNLPREETDKVRKNFACNANKDNDTSAGQYVRNIKDKSFLMKFDKLDKALYKENEDLYKKILRKMEKMSYSVNFKNNFTYKYGSVARLFYNKSDATILRTIIKKKCSISLINRFLENYKDSHTHAIILVDMENHERITIIKKGILFLWINSMHNKNKVIASINKSEYGMHHIFSIKPLPNHKYMNKKHNNMIFIISKYTSKIIRMADVKHFGNMSSINYEFIDFSEVQYNSEIDSVGGSSNR